MALFLITGGAIISTSPKKTFKCFPPSLLHLAVRVLPIGTAKLDMLLVWNTTLSGGDLQINSLNQCWKWDTGFGQIWCKCKLDNTAVWRLGTAYQSTGDQAILGLTDQHLLPGYVGMRFDYRWPDDNNRNYWSNSPVMINKMVFHYLDTTEWKDPLNQYYWQNFAAYLRRVQRGKFRLLARQVRDNSSRRSNAWKACYYEISSAARTMVAERQLMLFAISVEMKYNNRGVQLIVVAWIFVE